MRFSDVIPKDRLPYVGYIATGAGFEPDAISIDAVYVRFKKTHPEAFAPSISQAGDVGADVFALEDVVIPARGHALVRTGVIIEWPRGFRGRLQSRSGLSLKFGIEVGAGLIDTSFRKELGVVLHNHSDIDYTVENGMAVANLCVERYTYPVFEEVEELSETERTGGFGSSNR